MPCVERLSVRGPWYGGGRRGTGCADTAARNARPLPETIGGKRDGRYEAARSGRDRDIPGDRPPPCEPVPGASLGERDHVATRKHPCAGSPKESGPARLASPAHDGPVPARTPS